MAIKRPERDPAVAGRRRRDRQLLVGLGRLDEAAHLGREGRHRQRVGAVAVDPGRDLDDGRVGQIGECPVVAHVDDLDVAGAVVERCDQLRRRLAVEGPAAVGQQGGLLGEALIAVQLQQAAFDVDDVLGAGMAVALVVDHLRGLVVVAQVVGRDGADGADQLDRHADVLRDPGSVVRQQLRQPIDTVHARRPLPAEVVEPDLFELHPVGRRRQTASPACAGS